jgi:Uma2 family endonuclease
MQPQINNDYNSKLTVEEYVKLEQDTNQKYEFHDGYVYAMAGGTDNHNTIIMNISAEIYASLKGKDFRIKNSETKLWLENKNKYVYPDAMIICGEQEKAKNLKDAFTNPVVIIEVLSDSSVAYDRGDKFGFYRAVRSLRHYVLVEQKEAKMDIYSRKSATSLWDIQTIEGLESNLELEISETETLIISLKDIYYDVVFEK